MMSLCTSLHIYSCPWNVAVNSMTNAPNAHAQTLNCPTWVWLYLLLNPEEKFAMHATYIAIAHFGFYNPLTATMQYNLLIL